MAVLFVTLAVRLKGVMAMVRLRGYPVIILVGFLCVLAAAALRNPVGTVVADVLARPSGIADHFVLIDPGHGGRDSGARSPGGLREDEVVWAISEQLKSYLEDAGAYVAFTHTGKGIPRWEGGPNRDILRRVLMMQLVKPDLVVSIHANACTVAECRGPQAFYDPQASAGSKELAEAIQTQLRLLTGTKREASTNIDHAILSRATVPAVTVEVGFLSNPTESKLLANPDYQRKLAWAIFVGLSNYVSQASENRSTGQ